MTRRSGSYLFNVIGTNCEPKDPVPPVSRMEARCFIFVWCCCLENSVSYKMLVNRTRMFEYMKSYLVSISSSIHNIIINYNYVTPK